jgi:hypothetical protein
MIKLTLICLALSLGLAGCKILEGMGSPIPGG